MSQKLFGTDGVRGIANQELSPELAFRLGEAAAHFLGEHIVIGKDTRKSGDMLESMLAAGIMSQGATPHLARVIPTPAIAYLTKNLAMDGGIVVSASHNPPEYNGIKFFSAGGFKLPDALEDKIERYVLEESVAKGVRPIGERLGSLERIDDAAQRYIEHALSSAHDLSGLKVALDLGHGASSFTTPEAFRRLGAEVFVINDDYNGVDINVHCGSTHLEPLKAFVRECKADIGFAHDGDADRVLAVDETGEELDGDYILAFSALDLKDQGKLAQNTLVSTVMANLGLKKFLEAHDILFEQTQVGDRYVLERMQEIGAVLGGEQSGHIIFLDKNTTGDGLLTALELAGLLKKKGGKLSELKSLLKKYPQVLINVKVQDKSGLERNTNILEKQKELEDILGAGGRILLRASGTEPLIRVMVEAESEAQAQKIAKELADTVSKEL